ncbi:hypothetical protein TBR22_A31660 [Luteitalea sp. TBR-22]|uniref:hypothetical protein n=1 Tax=Luteitalea sp. TBR-22 TaxID=2802971 RepID=UPI001AF7D8C6|nr:hypothetical protein [Luteitalea sp. TBR-22]BCS33938.1 hypothetical protein TBR22_A31660 [Luteitalea sp. TBR-22]
MLTRPMRWFGRWDSPHLSDESLLELHALLTTGEHALAARYLRHVRRCDECAQRLEVVREESADLGRDVVAHLDGRISAARLDRQHDVILRRLEGQSGKVLPFPAAPHRPAPTQPHRRWVAMAAACGLMIGIGAGRLMGPGPLGRGPTWPAKAPTVRSVPVGVQQETDEQMLVEIDAALTRSRTKEFRALDELTPRIAEARARAKR